MRDMMYGITITISSSSLTIVFIINILFFVALRLSCVFEMGRGFGINRRGSKPFNQHGHHAHHSRSKFSQTRSNADMPSNLERFRYPHSDNDVSGGSTSRGFYMNQSLSIHDRLNTSVSGNYGHSHYGYGTSGQVHLSNLARTYGHSAPSSRFGSPSNVRARRFLNVMDIVETPIVKKDASMVEHTGEASHVYITYMKCILHMLYFIEGQLYMLYVNFRNINQ